MKLSVASVLTRAGPTDKLRRRFVTRQGGRTPHARVRGPASPFSRGWLVGCIDGDRQASCRGILATLAAHL